MYKTKKKNNCQTVLDKSQDGLLNCFVLVNRGSFSFVWLITCAYFGSYENDRMMMGDECLALNFLCLNVLKCTNQF